MSNIVGPMSYVCSHCRTLFYYGEMTGSGSQKRFLRCCKDGKVRPPQECQISGYPEILKDLLTKDDVEATNFRQNIRQYNNTFALASVRTNIPTRPGRCNSLCALGSL